MTHKLGLITYENSLYVSNGIFQTADERTSYHLLYFIAMDIVKNHKCNNKEDNKWMVFDQFCNEFATDDRDTEHTEIQLLMSLRAVFIPTPTHFYLKNCVEKGVG